MSNDRAKLVSASRYLAKNIRYDHDGWTNQAAEVILALCDYIAANMAERDGTAVSAAITDEMIDEGAEAIKEYHKTGSFGECPGIGWGEASACLEAALKARSETEPVTHATPQTQTGWMIEFTPMPKPLWYTGGLHKHQEPYATNNAAEAKRLRLDNLWGSKTFTPNFTDDPCKAAVYLTEGAAKSVLAELHASGKLLGEDCYIVTEHEWPSTPQTQATHGEGEAVPHLYRVTRLSDGWVSKWRSWPIPETDKAVYAHDPADYVFEYSYTHPSPSPTAAPALGELVKRIDGQTHEEWHNCIAYSLLRNAVEVCEASAFDYENARHNAANLKNRIDSYLQSRHIDYIVANASTPYAVQGATTNSPEISSSLVVGAQWGAKKLEGFQCARCGREPEEHWAQNGGCPPTAAPGLELQEIITDLRNVASMSLLAKPVRANLNKAAARLSGVAAQGDGEARVSDDKGDDHV